MSIRYNDNVILHFIEPINVGVLEQPDGVGVIGDMTCGDMMVMHIQVCGDRLADIKYQVFGVRCSHCHLQRAERDGDGQNT